MHEPKQFRRRWYVAGGVVYSLLGMIQIWKGVAHHHTEEIVFGSIAVAVGMVWIVRHPDYEARNKLTELNLSHREDSQSPTLGK
jgi:hypothetical protein